MNEGKVIFLDKTDSISEKELDTITNLFTKRKIKVEFASEVPNKGFYSIPEAILSLVQKGAKKVTAYPLSLGENYEMPLYWGTY